MKFIMTITYRNTDDYGGDIFTPVVQMIVAESPEDAKVKASRYVSMARDMSPRSVVMWEMMDWKDYVKKIEERAIKTTIDMEMMWGEFIGCPNRDPAP
jgi:hypothetical protein